MNEFDYFLTIHVTSKSDYSKLTDKLKKTDKNLKYLGLASWSMKSNLHYHILLKTSLTINEIYNKSKNLIDLDDWKKALKPISDIEGLENYFVDKNLRDDVIALLKKDGENDYIIRDKQLEILQHGKLISHSQNIIKPVVTKYDGDISISDIPELKDATFQSTKEFDMLHSNVRVDKYIKE